MSKFILLIYNYFSQRRKLLFLLLAGLIVFFAFAASRINFKEDISAFLPKSFDAGRINNAYQRLGSMNKLLVNVGMTDTSAAVDEKLIIDAVERFVEQLHQIDSTAQFFKRIDYMVDQQQILAISQFLTEKMPYFLTEADYLRMDTLLTEDYVRLQLENNRRMLMSPMSSVMMQNIMTDPLHLSATVLMGLSDFQVGEQFQLYNDFIFSNDRKEAVIIIESHFSPSETRQNAELLKIIAKAAAITQSEFEQQIKIHYFGSIDIAVTNANRIKRDSLLSSSISIILILSILIYAFRSAKNLLMMFGSLIFGWLFAFGLISVIRDEISLIAIGISSIIIGIAINYPLHFLQYHKQETRVSNVIKNIIAPLTIGNITTVGAFLSLMFIGSNAMRDLGLFASLLLVGTVCFVLVFLPHFLNRHETNRHETNRPLDTRHETASNSFMSKLSKNLKVSHLKVYKSKSLKVYKSISLKVYKSIFIILTIIFFIFSFNTKFDADMNNINYMTDAQRVDLEKYISVIEQGQQTIYFISEGNSLDEALAAYEASVTELYRLQEVGTLSNVSGLGVYLPSKSMQRQRIERWETFRESKKELFAKLEDIGVEKGFRAGAFSRFYDIVNTDFEVQDIEFFEPVVSSLANNYTINGKDGGIVVTILHTIDSDLDELATKLNEIDINSFAFDAGTLARSMVSALSADFHKVLFFCGSIVFLFLVFTLGRIELALLAFLPLTLGWFWILGIMSIFDIHFNIINIILATFIFGQGDDYTIFMTEGLMHEYKYKSKILASYKTSISLSAIIMFIGIGSLIFAKHPALRSLAEVTMIGMASVVLMAFVLPPMIFRWLTVVRQKTDRHETVRHETVRHEKSLTSNSLTSNSLTSNSLTSNSLTSNRLMPITLTNLASSVYAFMVFLFGSIVLTVVGFFQFTLGKTTDKKKLRYHRLIRWVSHFVVTHIPRVKTTYNNYDKTIFNKPAVIICNHQSHIDLMCVMSLTPKLIIITNDWVWNSPFYGRLIKYADYYPVSNGIDNAMDKLQAIVEKGYSIMIFPEGTRSEDCSIKRFHRGAFYLAEQLKIDILPVLIHGVGHLLPKKEFMLRKGEIHINVLPRMAYNAMGETYGIRAKNIRAFYKEEYAKLAAEVETADYYADLVLHNYIYKGPTVERTVRRNLKKHNNYRNIISQLKNENHVFIENCGYGEFPLLLSLVYKNMTIFATDPDKDKLELAANCAWVKENLKYVESLDTLDARLLDTRLIDARLLDL